MTPPHPTHATPQAPAPLTVAQAKAQLLTWAEDSDARARAARPSATSIAIGGGLALLSGFSIARLFSRPQSKPNSQATTGHRVVRWAAMIRLGSLVLPHLMPIVQKILKPRTAN